MAKTAKNPSKASKPSKAPIQVAQHSVLPIPKPKAVLSVKKPLVASDKHRAKELDKAGYNAKEIAEILGINKYDASKLIKG